LLDECLQRIRHRIRTDGLARLYWVSGIESERIASTLVLALAEHVRDGRLSPPGFRRHLLIKPEERELEDLFGGRFGCHVRIIDGSCEDSFLVVNDDAVLDVTPVPDGGRPELIEDHLVSSLYIDLFSELRKRSTATKQWSNGARRLPVALELSLRP
jgi:hypothetical protein